MLIHTMKISNTHVQPSYTHTHAYALTYEVNYHYDECVCDPFSQLCGKIDYSVVFRVWSFFTPAR